jgi:pantoate--beta-alanine ligase
VRVLTEPSAMRAWRRARGGTVGFVPTMGYLHVGHLSLVAAACGQNDTTVVSIFVNPTQFGPTEDFTRYPRDEVRDLALLKDAGVDAVYLPSVGDMYPAGHQTSVVVSEVTRRLEGAARPGHFDGVATVVTKLFNAVEADRAYFGRKDAQQLRVIQRMVRDLDMAVEIVPCDIVREPDGLAMSSRNVYLTPEQRAAAPIISRTLSAARDRFKDGLRSPDAIRDLVRTQIATSPLANIEYISVAANDSLEELEGPIAGRALLSVVVRFGNTRLLDNVELG